MHLIVIISITRLSHNMLKSEKK